MNRLLLTSMLALSFQVSAEALTPEHAIVPEMAVRVHFASQRETIRTCNDLNAWGRELPLTLRNAGAEAIGCAKIDNVAHVCDVYSPELTDTTETDRFATLGHEALHCFVGRYHE